MSYGHMDGVARGVELVVISGAHTQQTFES